MSEAVTIHTAMLRGIEAIPVKVEVSTSSGIPGITLVGNPDISVLESRSRVRCALKSIGVNLPRKHITINLSPGEIRKTGAGFDLPIAVALLYLTHSMPLADIDKCLFIGELALDGSVCPIRGYMAYYKLARALHKMVVCSALSVNDIHAKHTLYCQRLSEFMNGIPWLVRKCSDTSAVVLKKHLSQPVHTYDFIDVIDQEAAKRACVIAAAGNHGLLMIGPPGAGKTMLAQRIPSILPRLSVAQKDEALLIHSVAGLPLDLLSQGIPPFRAPHHSISTAGLIGGGRPVLPGEISLAHTGVLFLDELPEFASNVLQTLRQPFEEGEVRLIRAEGVYVFPGKFMFIAAANPCPCGYLGDSDHECVCTEAKILKYQSKLSGPLVDRIDMCIDIQRPSPQKILNGVQGLSSAQMQAMVEKARAFRAQREEKLQDALGGACSRASSVMDQKSGGKQSKNKGIAREALSPEAKSKLNQIALRTGLGGRGLSRIVHVARTIADLAEHERVEVEDMLEACMLRNRKGSL